MATCSPTPATGALDGWRTPPYSCRRAASSPAKTEYATGTATATRTHHHVSRACCGPSRRVRRDGALLLLLLFLLRIRLFSLLNPRRVIFFVVLLLERRGRFRQIEERHQMLDEIGAIARCGCF